MIALHTIVASALATTVQAQAEAKLAPGTKIFIAEGELLELIAKRSEQHCDGNALMLVVTEAFNANNIGSNIQYGEYQLLSIVALYMSRIATSPIFEEAIKHSVTALIAYTKNEQVTSH